MTQAEQLVDLTFKKGVAYISLENPTRHNTLTMPLLEQLLACFQTASKDPSLKCVVLQASGKSFSTGGDINAFIEHEDDIEQYAHQLVGLLNQTILFMLRMQTPIIAKIQGPVTGGSMGLVFASDLVAMADTAFFAPYYVEVGFAPDGGWTAILPQLISRKKALEIQLLNHHISPKEAHELQLVHTVCKSDELNKQVSEWVDSLSSKVSQSVVATKTLLQDDNQIKMIEEALEQERQAFIRCITQPAAKEGMKQFVQRFKRKEIA